jgi:hypothetical protein
MMIAGQESFADTQRICAPKGLALDEFLMLRMMY